MESTSPIRHSETETKPLQRIPSISYGTFSPQPRRDWSQVGKSEDCDLKEHSLEPGGSSYPPSSWRDFRQHSRGSESGFDSDYTNPVSKAASPSHQTSSWTSWLFEEMERNLSETEEELKRISSAEDEGFSEENLDVTSTVVSVNTDSKDYDMIEIEDNFMSDADDLKNCRSAFGILCRLKRRLESDCAKLDRLVGMDTPAHETEVVRDQIKIKGFQFRDRMDTCLTEVDSRMEKIRHKNEIIIDGVRHNWKHSESSVIKMVRNSPVKCVTWMHVLLFISTVLIVCFMFLWNDLSDQWVVYLRLVRSPLIVIFLLYLYGVNMKVWAKYNINYVTIFNHHPEATPTPAHLFKMAGALTIVFSGLVIALILASPFSVILPIKIIPLTMWLILLGFLFNPFKCFFRRGRFNFLSVFVHILLAPLIFVFFTDFFLADQFNSTVAVFLDVHYTFCYFFTDSWSGKVNTGICTSSGNGIRPIISFLPAMWRMLQCFRCYYDTYNVKHLINAGKYFTTFPVIVFATLYSTKVKGDIFESFASKEVAWILIFWAVSSLIHAVYTFLWDVCCDWGLWDVMKCKMFHRRLIYRHKILYVVAILLDFVLRFLWTLKLTLAIVWQADSDLIYTGLVLGEVLRRFVWNFFRVEFAHVS